MNTAVGKAEANRVEPEHVDGMIVPERHDQHHPLVQLRLRTAVAGGSAVVTIESGPLVKGRRERQWEAKERAVRDQVKGSDMSKERQCKWQ